MNGWQQRDNTLVRELQLRDFDEALGFVEQIAARAEDYGRRPDVSIEAG